MQRVFIRIEHAVSSLPVLSFNLKVVVSPPILLHTLTKLSYCFLHFISLPLISDDSEDGITLGMQYGQLMGKVGLAEGVIHELTNELRLSVTVRRSSFRIAGQKLLCLAT